MPITPNLALPLLAAAQAQKHVTHNEALSTLDALVQLAVLERRATPPGTPQEGERHLVAVEGSGEFAGRDGQIALFDLGAWRFLAPRPGWVAYVGADDALLVFDGTAWRALAAYAQQLDDLPRLGIGTAADAVNRLAAKLNAALFTARSVGEEGTGDLRFVLNKEEAGNVLAQLYQRGYSGRAETGLIGDDDFRIRVSADGSEWRDALRIDHATGVVSFPTGAVGLSHSRNLLINPDGAINQRVFAGGALAQGVYGYDRWKAGPGGCSIVRAADETFTLTGPLVQVIERPGLAGEFVTISVENPTGPLTVTVEGVSETIVAGTGRRGVGLAVPATATGNVTLTLSGSGVSFARPVLNRGPAAEPFERLPAGVALALCQRYYVKTFPPATRPAPNVGSAGALISYAIVSNSIPVVRWQFPVPMRATPTLTFFNPSDTNAQWSTGGANAVVTFGTATAESVRIGTATIPTVNPATFSAIHAVAEAEL